jgi:hypothetical protein
MCMIPGFQSLPWIRNRGVTWSPQWPVCHTTIYSQHLSTRQEIFNFFINWLWDYYFCTRSIKTRFRRLLILFTSGSMAIATENQRRNQSSMRLWSCRWRWLRLAETGMLADERFYSVEASVTVRLEACRCHSRVRARSRHQAIDWSRKRKKL